MLGDGVANKAEYLEIGCSDLGERVSGELLDADAASGRGCFQPGEHCGRHLDAQGHAPRVQIGRAEERARPARPLAR